MDDLQQETTWVPAVAQCALLSNACAGVQILETLLRIQAAFDQPQAYDSEGGLREAVTPPSPRSLQPSWEAYSESSDSPSDPLAVSLRSCQLLLTG